MRAFGVLFRHRRDHRHAAVARLSAQPAKKTTSQHRRIDPIRFGPPVFA
jgi:hypothetical protein